MAGLKRTHDDYTVGWICPLEVEQIAALEMLDQEHERLPQPPSDNNSYLLGSIQHHNIVIVGLPTTGNCSTATVVAHLRSTFPKIRFGLLVGIGGGVPVRTEVGHIRLGHIVVSKPVNEHSGVVQYDHGKAQAGQFVRTGFLAPPPNILLSAANRLGVKRARAGEDPLLSHLQRIDTTKRNLRRYKSPGQTKDTLYQSTYLHADRNKSCEKCGCDQSKLIVREADSDAENGESDTENQNPSIVIHRGTIASGELIIRCGQLRDELVRQHDILCFEMEAAGALNDFPCLVIRGISDYSDSHKNDRWHGYAAAVAAAYARELFFHLPISEVAQCKVMESDIQQLLHDTHDTAQSMQGIKYSVEHTNTRFILSRLAWADGATFDAFEGSEEANRTCLDDTRVDLFEEIQAWIDDPAGKTLFWLNGMAGTGKSTISRTLAHRLQQRNQLGASFFFKTGQGDRGSAKRLFTTIASQMAQHFPLLVSPIRNVLESDDPYISDKAIGEQFTKLIYNPLELVKDRITSPIVMVIDALDECKPGSHAEAIPALFSELRHLSPLRLRVFLTSRPEQELRSGFETVTPSRYHDIILHQIPAPVIAHDIEIFFRYHFQLIRNKNKNSFSTEWPGEVVLSALVAKAQPLFIIAATICRFVGDPRHNANARLESILAGQDNQAYDKIHNTYEPILNRLVEDATSADHFAIMKNFQHVVGSIVVLCEPLSVSSLAHLLSRKVETIDPILNGLHSVLDVAPPDIPEGNTRPVRMLHLSFADFLLDHRRQNTHSFWLDAKSLHQTLAERCLDILLSVDCPLKQDICGMKLPGTLRTDIDTVLIDRHLAPEIKYVCQHWITHVMEARHSYLLYYSIHKFLEERFLFWFEAMSFLGRAWEVGPKLSSLLTLVSKSQNSEFKAVLHDARRFALANTYIADMAPLQIYLSSTVFAPQKTVIKSSSSTSGWPRRLSTTETHWGHLLQTLEGHGGFVQCVAFSCDGKIIASGSNDMTIKLWNAITGQLQQTLTGHTNRVYTVACSPVDSNLLASGAGDGIIKYWNMTSGQLLQSVESGFERLLEIVFSPDGRSLAVIPWASAVSDIPVQLYNVLTGKMIKAPVLDGNESCSARSIGFSRDGALLAQMSLRTGSIDIWHAETGRLQGTIRLPGVMDLAFSPTHDQLLAIGGVGPIQIWNIQTRQLWRTFSCGIANGDRAQVHEVAFSPDGQLLAGACNNDMIYTWLLDSERHQPQILFPTDCGECRSINFSPNGQVLACGGDSATIQLWDMSSEHLLTQQESEILEDTTSVALSHDGQSLAKASHPNSISVWEVASGNVHAQRVLHACSKVHALAFSVDDKTLAAGCDKGHLYFWNLSSKSKQSHRILNLIDGSVSSIGFSPDGKSVAAAAAANGVDEESQVVFCQINSAKFKRLQHIYLDHWDTVEAISYSPGGSVLASGDGERIIKFWSVDSGDLLHSIKLEGHVKGLWFDAATYRIESDLGGSALSPDIPRGSDWNGPRRELCASADWLLRNGQKALWIPPKYRAHVAISGTRVVFGTISGEIVILEVSLDELDRALLV